jgi:tetratricopeptide (TPR) repeat protein
MINAKDALSWLNYAEHSHITQQCQTLTSKALNEKKLKEEKDREIQEAISASKVSNDALEYPEVLTRSGIAKLLRNHYEEAKIFLEEAVVIYFHASDHHRLAVTKWILGIIEWRLGDNNSAINHWWEARDHFAGILSVCENALKVNFEEGEKNKEKDFLVQDISWYQTRLDDMIIELVLTFEEVYTWVNFFREHASHLSPVTQHLKDSINNQVKRKNYANLDQKISEMKRLAQLSYDYHEKPEVYIFCALIYYQMGDFMNSEKLLQQSLELHTPESHNRAVVQWLLGLIQSRIPDEKALAVQNLFTALDIFKNLASRKDQLDDQPARQWYLGKIPVLARSLEKILI